MSVRSPQSKSAEDGKDTQTERKNSDRAVEAHRSEAAFFQASTVRGVGGGMLPSAARADIDCREPCDDRLQTRRQSDD
eukprot:SAG11_NODE_2593_length_3187_cov_2.489637_5_plen_78_part_00